MDVISGLGDFIGFVLWSEVAGDFWWLNRTLIVTLNYQGFKSEIFIY